MSNPLHHALDDAATSAGIKILAAGSVTAGGSGMAGKVVRQAAEDPSFAERAMSLADIGVIVGITLGVIGYLTQLFFHIRRDRRDKKLADLREKVIRERVGGNDPA